MQEKSIGILQMVNKKIKILASLSREIADGSLNIGISRNVGGVIMDPLDQALKMYSDFFGQNYPLCIVRQTSDEEEIAEIMKCIERGEPAKDPEYIPGAIY